MQGKKAIRSVVEPEIPGHGEALGDVDTARFEE
jgi:hypothetical protein